MVEIMIPAIPAGVLTLLSFFSPYAIALINHPGWKPGSKRLIAILVSVVLTVIVLGLYYFQTGDIVPQWPALLFLGLVVSQAAYTLLWPSAKNVEGRHGTT